MHTCISSHGLKRSWRSCPRRVNAGNKNTPSTHHPRRRNVTTLMVGFKKRSHKQKSHPKVANPRDIAGERKKTKKQKKTKTENKYDFHSLRMNSQALPSHSQGRHHAAGGRCHMICTQLCLGLMYVHTEDTSPNSKWIVKQCWIVPFSTIFSILIVTVLDCSEWREHRNYLVE